MSNQDYGDDTLAILRAAGERIADAVKRSLGEPGTEAAAVTNAAVTVALGHAHHHLFEEHRDAAAEITRVLAAADPKAGAAARRRPPRRAHSSSTARRPPAPSE